MDSDDPIKDGEMKVMNDQAYVEEYDEDDMYELIEEVEDVLDQDADEDSESDDNNIADCPKISHKLTVSHKEAVFSVSMSPNNELFVTASQEDKACVWNTNTGELVFECTGHEDSVIDAKFSHDGTFLATGDMNGCVKVWKVATKSLHDEYSMPDEVSWLIWHQASNVLFAGCKDGDSYMWRLPTMELKILFGNGNENTCGCLLPDGKRIVIGYKDGSVGLYDLKTAKKSWSYKNKFNLGAMCIDTYHDNNLIAVGFESLSLGFIKASNGSEIFLKDPNENADDDDAVTEAVKFGVGPTDGILAAAFDDEIQLWDFSRQTLRKKIIINRERIGQLAWSKNGILYAGGVFKNKIYGFDGRSGEMISIFDRHNKPILCIAISNDSKYLLSSSEDGTVNILCIETETIK